MAVYTVGSARIRVGSAIIRGNNTDFSTYVSSGELFKRTSEGIIYTIATVYTATRLALTTRYSNSNEQTSRSENTGSCTATNNSYSGTFTYSPVIQGYVVVTASERFIDDSGGALTGENGGSGTIDYDSGAYTLTLGKVLHQIYNVTASYYSGNTLDSEPYQIIRDYTSYYTLPESSPADKNMAYIYTKAMRMVDTKLHNLESRIASLGG